MKKTSETIVFFGSGPVAAKSLELLAQHFEVEAVITKPKPEHHRGGFPVLEICEKYHFTVFTPSNKQELTDLFKAKPVKSRVGVVIDYGIIIAQEVIDYFPLGIVNSHFSLLPEWRGADPISFAILSGQPKTGVSLMVIDAGMDTGKLITYRGLPITNEDTTPSLTEKLIDLSDELLAEYLPKYIKGEVAAKQQPHPDRATYSRKLTKEDGLIDWTKPADQVEREIRAFIEWPKSRTSLGNVEVIITKAHAVPGVVPNQKPGDITLATETHEVGVATGSGTLWIEQLKPAGKSEMTAKAFLAGYHNRLDI